MDKYDVIHDYYCYPQSTVLKNKLNITDTHVFEQAERDITSITTIDGVQVEYGKMEKIFSRILRAL